MAASAAGSRKWASSTISASGRGWGTTGSAPRVRVIVAVGAAHSSGSEDANSRASRDFPVPASPVITTSRVPPWLASRESVRSSSSRSTSTGQCATSRRL